MAIIITEDILYWIGKHFKSERRVENMTNRHICNFLLNGNNQHFLSKESLRISEWFNKTGTKLCSI